MICARPIHLRNRGQFRSRQAHLKPIKRDPSVSATHFAGDDIPVIVHGRAELIDRSHPDAPVLEEAIGDLYGSSPFSWGQSVFLARIEPETMLTYSRDLAQAEPPTPRSSDDNHHGPRRAKSIAGSHPSLSGLRVHRRDRGARNYQRRRPRRDYFCSPSRF
jgi:hypothetical protein